MSQLESAIETALSSGRATTKPTRVLVVGARGIPDVEGGAEKNAEALFPRMAALGFDVTLMGLKSNIKARSYNGVALRSAPDSRLLNTDKLAYYATALVEAIRLRPHIVHLQGLGAAITLLVYKLLGFKVVVRYGSADYLLPKWGLIGRLGFLASEWQLRFADAVIAVSPALKHRLATRGITRNVHIIANAIDAIQEKAEPSLLADRPYILMVGRVTSQKNVTTLLEAFRIFSAAHPTYDLLIAGGLADTKYVEDLQPLLTERTKLLGGVSRTTVSDLLESACLFVNLSLHEGSSNATLEAISHGCPILISAIPENLDLGLPAQVYVDQLDAQAIAARLEEAVAKPTRSVVDPTPFLSWEQVRDQTVAVYSAILSVEP